MLVDVEYRTLQKMPMKSGSFFIYDGNTTIELYYISKAPVIFRSIIKKDKNYLEFISSLKEVIPILKPIKEQEELKTISNRLDEIYRFLKIGR